MTNADEVYAVEDYPGARLISDNIIPPENIDPIPDLVNVKNDFPSFYEDKGCFSSQADTGVKMCSYGTTDDPDYTIALVGGSHSGHWFPALEVVAQELNLQIDLYYKDACRLTTENFDGDLSESCMDWNKQIMEPLINNPPDLVFTTANVGNSGTIPTGYLNKWKELEGITKVFAVRDNPRMLLNPSPCLEETPNECSVPREDALSQSPPWEKTENLPGHVYFADMSEYFCDEKTCSPVIGNVLVYRDFHHITATYSETMGPALAEKITEVLNELEVD